MSLRMKAFAVLSVFAASACGRSAKEKSAPAQWDGKTPLGCSNGEVVRLVDCSADLPGQTAINASNGCQLSLERCTINAETAISANASASIRLVDTKLVGSKIGLALWNHTTVDATGGRIEGGEAAMSLVNDVKVSVNGTTVVGPVKRWNGSEVSGLPELEADQAAERVANAFGVKVCELAWSCYKGHLGDLAGRFTVELQPDGRVVAADFDGKAPASALSCLKSPSGKRVVGFAGPRGKLQCSYAGRIGPSSFEMDRSWSFAHLPAQHEGGDSVRPERGGGDGGGAAAGD